MLFVDTIRDVFDRFLNPHRRHGFQTGSTFSAFWFDLKNGSELLEQRFQRAPVDGRAWVACVLARQRYEILRAAHYGQFAHSITVGHQLSMAAERIRESLHEQSEDAGDHELSALASRLLIEATDRAEAVLIEEFGSTLDSGLRFWFAGDP